MLKKLIFKNNIIHFQKKNVQVKEIKHIIKCINR